MVSKRQWNLQLLAAIWWLDMIVLDTGFMHHSAQPAALCNFRQHIVLILHPLCIPSWLNPLLLVGLHFSGFREGIIKMEMTTVQLGKRIQGSEFFLPDEGYSKEAVTGKDVKCHCHFAIPKLSSPPFWHFSRISAW